jgi:hypothetical protein
LRLVAVCAALLPIAAACGIQASGITTLGAAPAAAHASSAVGGTEIGSNQYQLFFYQNDRLTPVLRPAPGTLTETFVLKELLGGPTAEEKEQGFTSALPEKLVATPNAEQERFAFALSGVLGPRGRSEFICTMQNFDGTDSIGIESAGSPQSMIWTGCSDTTNQYVPMQGPTVAAATTAP